MRSLRDFVRETLLARIARGEMPAGFRVIEAVLVEEFDISATPIREAIRELVAMGVLEARHNRGATVREVSLKETKEAFQVRASLESLAASILTVRINEQCNTLRQAADEIVKAASSGDFAAFQEHNQNFHRTIVASCNNSVLLRTWDSLFFQVRTRWTMDYLQSVDPIAIAKEHLPIVDALEIGNLSHAALLLATHSNHLVDFLNNEAGRREESIPMALSKKEQRRKSSTGRVPDIGLRAQPNFVSSQSERQL